ncbi:type II secretion system F family protein [Ferrimonas sp. SCSIO 43195]|uniref:type II secretion system F family protein n=1 Tax=Ferrimonas sp. SCSIO 43195 TaxID=2822844 RepID=UPI0020757EE3|nr:type II secretion system F family protein [Ferrimonas sp. SCSIO 43195]USD38804.1 type II secretion system F family protein [Ferrimonas sp. SCSIO 43195]
MVYLTLFIAFSLALALLATRAINQRAREARIRQYLTPKDGSAISWLNQFLGTLGQNQQKEVQQKLIEAGIYQGSLARYFMPAKYVLLALTLLTVVLVDLSQTNKILLAALSLITIIVMPDLLLGLRKKWLITKTARQLPYMLDMMAVCIQTGMTIEASFRYLGEELQAFDKDLCYQIRRTSDAASIKGLEKALHDLSERLPTPEVRSFAFTLIQNLQYGTSIAKVLGDLSEDMRRMQVLSMEEKIGKLSAKMSIPLILLIMFPIVILILAPGISQLMMEFGQ